MKRLLSDNKILTETLLQKSGGVSFLKTSWIENVIVLSHPESTENALTKVNADINVLSMK